MGGLYRAPAFFYRPMLPLAISLLIASVCAPQTVNPLSVASLLLQMKHDEVILGTATGFVVPKNAKYYLFTNRHVVLACGEDQNPTNTGGWICANKLSIFHNTKNHLGQWHWVSEDLFDAHQQKRWLEHPILAGAVDLVALPLTHAEDVEFYPLDIARGKTDIKLTPGDTVSIIGFPFGLSQTAGLAIWKTGTVASDLDINYNGKPVFIIDTTSRPGMSGSPVYAIRTGSYQTSGGNLMFGGGAIRFLGVYSAQSVNAELGFVCKAEVVQALYDSLP